MSPRKAERKLCRWAVTKEGGGVPRNSRKQASCAGSFRQALESDGNASWISDGLRISRSCTSSTPARRRILVVFVGMPRASKESRAAEGTSPVRYGFLEEAGRLRIGRWR